LTELQKSKRIIFAVWFRRSDDAKAFRTMPKMFSDEKIFTVDGGRNNQNIRIYAASREEANENGGRDMCF
jgi:hypothetical protein